MCMANSYCQQCNHLCEKHKFPKGLILFWNHSERGQGWCFWLYVPLTTWSQTLTPLHQTTLKSYSRFFFFFGAHLFVNKKMQWKQRGIRFKPAWNMPSVSQPNPTDSPRGACSSQCSIVRRIWKLWQALPVKPHLMPVDTLLWLGLHLITEQRSTSQQFVFYKLE